MAGEFASSAFIGRAVEPGQRLLDVAQEAMLRLHVLAPMRLTRAALPILLGNLAVYKRGRVEWDPKNLKPLNDPSLEKIVRTPLLKRRIDVRGVRSRRGVPDGA